MTVTLAPNYDDSCLTKAESDLARWINGTAEFANFTGETDPGERFDNHIFIDAAPFSTVTDAIDRENIALEALSTKAASQNFCLISTPEDGFTLVYDATDSEYLPAGQLMATFHKLLSDADLSKSELPMRDFRLSIGKIMEQMARAAVASFGGVTQIVLNDTSRQHLDKRYEMGDELSAMITVTYDLTTGGGEE